MSNLQSKLGNLSLDDDIDDLMMNGDFDSFSQMDPPI